MSTEKKNEKERSVEERLTALYRLQSCLSEIDRIKFLRGELPNEVKDLEDEMIGYETRIRKHLDEIEDLKGRISADRGFAEEQRMKIEKYNEQINNVRNNREFSFLEKEKEYASLEIEHAEKRMRDSERLIAEKEEEVAATRERLSDTEHILADKRTELESIVEETRQREAEIREEAKTLEDQVNPYTLAAFKRIRKNARNGLGIVCVERNACGGCFNRIPPQRQLEIKMHKKVIVCEYCGRILVDAQLAGKEEEKPAEQPVKRTRAKRAPKAAAIDVLLEDTPAPAPEAPKQEAADNEAVAEEQA